MLKKTFLAALISLAGSSAHAVAVSETNDGATLVNSLLGSSSGITVDGNSINVIGNSTQSGTYTGISFAGNGTVAAPSISLGSGIVMTSGAATVPTANTAPGFSIFTGTGSSSIVTGLTGLASNDQNLLSFNFTAAPGVTSIGFKFVFGSDEYPEFAGTQFADGFGVIVDGVNYAKFGDGSIVSLKTLASNANLFNNSASVYPIEYDGITPVLSLTGILDPSRTTHTLQLAIADTGDSALDSGVFISSLSGGTGTGGGGITPNVPEPSEYAMLIAGLGMVGIMTRRRMKS